MFEKGFLSKAYAPKEKGDSNKKRKEVPKKIPVFDVAKNAEKKKKHKGDEANLSQEKAQQSNVGTSPLSFKPGVLDKKPQETKNEVSGKQKSRDITKDTDKSSKEVETKYSRSEGGPQYLTDKGNPIPIVKSHQPTRSPERQALEEELVQEMRKDRGQQISDYDSSYNCHGYVFTDGKAGWINTTATVEKILKENGFKKIVSVSYGNRDYVYTQLPKKEDIVIYRNKHNKAVHSGVIVEYSNKLDNILVSSKIGHFGVFQHPLTNSCIQRDLLVTHWEIYHTDRLQGRIITETS